MEPKKARDIYLLSPLHKEGTIYLPMISFSITTDHIEFGDCDTLMFTSKQAVKSADSIDKKWKEYPSVAIGSATKREIEELGGRVVYCPKNFYGKELAEDIANYFEDRKILYLRPKKVSFDSKGYLASRGITLQEQIIYETRCIEHMPESAPSESAIIIFTSPSTIHCFLKNFSWHPSYTAVVIGRATLEHLPDGANYTISDKPTISACITKAKELAKSTA